MKNVEVGCSLIFLMNVDDASVPVVLLLGIETYDVGPQVDNPSVILELLLEFQTKVEGLAISIHAISIIFLIIKTNWIWTNHKPSF